MKPLLPLTLALTLATPVVAQAPNWSKAPTIAIDVTDHGFVPRRVVLRSGRPYILRVTNRHGQGHNLTARSFFGNARVAPRDGGLVRHDQIVLRAGERVTVRVVAPTTPGARYDFRSTTLADATSDYTGAIFVR